MKLAAYIVSATMAALAAVLIIGWQGSAINALGTGYELRVIASTMIGGANLMGGEGTAYGAFLAARRGPAIERYQDESVAAPAAACRLTLERRHGICGKARESLACPLA